MILRLGAAGLQAARASRPSTSLRADSNLLHRSACCRYTAGKAPSVVPTPCAAFARLAPSARSLCCRYTAGKVPKAFKIIPVLSNWEEVLYLTDPEKWSAHAVYQATRLFISNLNAKMVRKKGQQAGSSKLCMCSATVSALLFSNCNTGILRCIFSLPGLAPAAPQSSHACGVTVHCLLSFRL